MQFSGRTGQNCWGGHPIISSTAWFATASMWYFWWTLDERKPRERGHWAPRGKKGISKDPRRNPVSVCDLEICPSPSLWVPCKLSEAWHKAHRSPPQTPRMGSYWPRSADSLRTITKWFDFHPHQLRQIVGYDYPPRVYGRKCLHILHLGCNGLSILVREMHNLVGWLPKYKPWLCKYSTLHQGLTQCPGKLYITPRKSQT